MVLGGSSYKGDQATSETTLEYDGFELSFNEYIKIFNELMRHMRAMHYFDVLPKIFNNYYAFKKKGTHSTLGVFKPKYSKGPAR